MAEEYFELADTASLLLLPLFAQPKRRDDPEDIAATIRTDEEHEECVGVLILEGIERPLSSSRVFRRWERIRTAVSDAVANSRQYDGLWLMPVWRALVHTPTCTEGTLNVRLC